MTRNTITLLMGLALIGCGGGGGSSSGGGGSEPTPEPECGNAPDMACSYELSELKTKVTLMRGAFSEKFTAYIDIRGGNNNVTILDDHSFDLKVDGQSYPSTPDGLYSALKFLDVPTDGQTYELFWYQSDTLVNQIATQVVAKTLNVEIEGFNNIDTGMVRWNGSDSEHTYVVELSDLTCNELTEQPTTYPLLVENRIEAEMASQFELSLLDLYGKTLIELEEENVSCQLMVGVKADRKMDAGEPNAQLTVASYTHAIAFKNLFNTP